MASIFDNCKPLVARWLKLGESQVFTVEPIHEVYYIHRDYYDALVVENQTKKLFELPIDSSVPRIEESSIKKITAQRFIKCDYEDNPVVEDERVITTARIIKLEA